MGALKPQTPTVSLYSGLTPPTPVSCPGLSWNSVFSPQILSSFLASRNFPYFKLYIFSESFMMCIYVSVFNGSVFSVRLIYHVAGTQCHLDSLNCPCNHPTPACLSPPAGLSYTFCTWSVSSREASHLGCRLTGPFTEGFTL